LSAEVFQLMRSGRERVTGREREGEGGRGREREGEGGRGRERQCVQQDKCTIACVCVCVRACVRVLHLTTRHVQLGMATYMRWWDEVAKILLRVRGSGIGV
jgi:hypothetical protein